MKKYKVYFNNDPQEEKIFHVMGENIIDATIKASNIKSLSTSEFLKIFSIKENKYGTYV
jgi:hypothetical protein|tara:strand:- start:1101 stop:1277 length:177 start_codon:yes stop_codon:yes gene_type:complete